MPDVLLGKVEDYLLVADVFHLAQTCQTLARRPLPPWLVNNHTKPVFSVDPRLFFHGVTNLPPVSATHTTGWWSCPVFLDGATFYNRASTPTALLAFVPTHLPTHFDSCHPFWRAFLHVSDNPFDAALHAVFPLYPQLLFAGFWPSPTHLSLVLPYLTKLLHLHVSVVPDKPRFSRALLLKHCKTILYFALSQEVTLKETPPLLHTYLCTTDERMIVSGCSTTYANLPDLLQLGARHAPKLIVNLDGSLLVKLLHDEDLHENLVTYLRAYYWETSLSCFVSTFGDAIRDFFMTSFVRLARDQEDTLHDQISSLTTLMKNVDTNIGAYVYNVLRSCLVKTLCGPCSVYGPLKSTLLNVFMANLLPMLNAGALKSFYGKPFMRMADIDTTSGMPEHVVRDFYTSFLMFCQGHASAFVEDAPFKLELLRIGFARPEFQTMVAKTLDVIQVHKKWLDADDDDMSLDGLEC